MRYQVQPSINGTFAVVDTLTSQVYGTFGSSEAALSIAYSMNLSATPAQPGGLSYSPSIY